MQINVLHMAHLTSGYGTEKQLLNYLAAAKDTSNEIKHHVCALRISEPIKKELKRLGIPFIVNRLKLRELLAFKRFISQHTIQILHVHNRLRAPFMSRILPKLLGIPIILEHEHGMVWNLSSTRLVKLTNRWVDANICNSQAAKIMLREKCGIDAKVIYNGVQLNSEPVEKSSQSAALAELSQAAPIVGYVGRLNNPKGAEAFIRMSPLVNQAVPQARFVVIGDGPLRDKLAKEAESLGVGAVVYFLGYQPNAYRLMKQIDVVVMPSFREAFGNVAVEAALAGKPVIASNVDGLAEVIVDGETGFLVECNEPLPVWQEGADRLPTAVVDGCTRQLRGPYLPNTKLLADKVIACLQNPQLAESLGNNACERAKSLFAIKRYCADLDKLYRELICR